ncbi:MAG TPA: class I SAM-dependent methyltransferase [Patescibacteria group bacterium]|nr:class I SAM-dependent methyltransferase [Patescibacteria group bacterium]
MPLTSGNCAKIYCLDWLDKYLLERSNPVKILDLGCGEALNFVNLLAKYSKRISYTGVEPDDKACQLARENLRGLPATIINSYAYKLTHKLEGKFDVVISFSALEHVYHRLAFLQTAKEYLVSDGYFLINYDAGHFVSGRERFKNIIGPLLAPLGLEKYYQSLVKEEEFRRLIQFVGFEIIDQKFFNTKLKGVAKVIPPGQLADFSRRWLECELWLNNLDIKYTDDLAPVFETRNFILQHKK